ncbi:hypothetical protein F4679DRAFT_558253 [Xylaria curta]|nr:hypothetical protein F4679DRAFT_558253 [Xylaria curta]
MFPEDRKLTLRAHDAGVDVIMAYRLALAYILQVLDMFLPGKIDSFTSTADNSPGGWKIDDDKANALLKRLQEAGSSTIMSQVASDDEEDEEAQVMGDACRHASLVRI